MKSNTNSKWWALGALTLAVLAVGLDATILSVAIPTLATALNAKESDLQWFSSGYLLTLAAAMLPAGLLGDRFGRKKVMLMALLLFGCGSIASAYSQTPGEFIAARTILGVAGAGIVVMAVSTMTVLFTEEERPKAVAIWGIANFLSMPIGPILGGWLLTHYWWGWVFLINAPVALIGLLATLMIIPESRAPVLPSFDVLGVLFSTGGLVSLTYGLIEAGHSGWTDPSAVIPMIAGVIVLAGFFFWERWLGGRPHGQPLVDLTLFRSTSFTWGVLLAAVLVLSMVGVMFTLPQYFQGVQGINAMGSGVRLIPLVVGLTVGAGLTTRLLKVIGAKFGAAIGFAILAAGMFLGSTTNTGSGDNFLILWTAIAGIGLGITMATTVSAALIEISAENSGVASAVMQALQKTGGPLGAAIMGSVLSAAYQNQLQLNGLPPSVAAVARSSLFGGLAVAQKLHSSTLLGSVHIAFINGMDASLVVAAGIAGAGVILALLFLPHRTQLKQISAQEGQPSQMENILL